MKIKNTPALLGALDGGKDYDVCVGLTVEKDGCEE